MGQVVAINVGRAVETPWAASHGKLGRTAIGKLPVTGPVTIGRLGLEGDETGN